MRAFLITSFLTLPAMPTPDDSGQREAQMDDDRAVVLDLLQRERELDPRLIALYRSATPEEKLLAVARLNNALVGLKDAQLKSAQPQMDAAARRVQLRRWWLGARD